VISHFENVRVVDVASAKRRLELQVGFSGWSCRLELQVGVALRPGKKTEYNSILQTDSIDVVDLSIPERTEQIGDLRASAG